MRKARPIELPERMHDLVAALWDGRRATTIPLATVKAVEKELDCAIPDLVLALLLAHARGAVAANLDVRGLSQTELVARMGITKQAVQQLLDALEAEGVVRRVPDPEDRRGKRVEYTARGLAAVRDANAIKRRMERELSERLGARAFDELRAALREVAATFEER